MKFVLRFLSFFLLIITFTSQAEVNGDDHFMDQKTMEDIIKSIADEAEGQQGLVKFTIQGMELYLISDIRHDRMRIISPIANYSELSAQQIGAAMESNFHLALDARYAVSDGVLYSAYIHPLSSLTENQVKSAVFQVFNLKASFGTAYSSGLLNFGGEKEKPAEQI